MEVADGKWLVFSEEKQCERYLLYLAVFNDIKKDEINGVRKHARLLSDIYDGTMWVSLPPLCCCFSAVETGSCRKAVNGGLPTATPTDPTKVRGTLLDTSSMRV